MLGWIHSWCQSHGPRFQQIHAEELQTWVYLDHMLFLYGSVDVTDFLSSPSCSPFPISWTRSSTSVKSRKTGPTHDYASLHSLIAEVPGSCFVSVNSAVLLCKKHAADTQVLKCLEWVAMCRWLLEEAEEAAKCWGWLWFMFASRYM